MKFDIGVFFENLSRKLKFDYYLNRITATSDEDVCTYTICCLILLINRNVSGNILAKTKTHFLFNNYFQKIVTLMR
jgi:hypothetical protein